MRLTANRHGSRRHRSPHQGVNLLAVSIANGGSYCVPSHTSATRAKGLTPAQNAEILAVFGLAHQTDGLVTALGVPLGPAFDANAS